MSSWRWLSRSPGRRPELPAPTGILLSAVAGQGAWVEDTDGRRPLLGKAPSSNGRIRLGTNRYHTRAADWPILIRVAERAGLAPPKAPSVFHARAFFDLGHGAAYEVYPDSVRGRTEASSAANGTWAPRT